MGAFLRLLPRSIIVAVIGVASAGCPEQGPPTPPPMSMINYSVPVFTPLPETKDRVDLGAVVLTAAPVSYEAAISATPEEKVVSEGDEFAFTHGRKYRRHYKLVESTAGSKVVVKPDSVRFDVTISNHSTHVFRGQGAVVRFRVAGKTLSGPQDDYAEFLNLIVLPNDTQTVHVNGPKISSLPEAATPIALDIYDVTTATDPAGNVTERKNAEWMYTYTPEAKEKEVTKGQTTRKMVYDEPVLVQ